APPPADPLGRLAARDRGANVAWSGLPRLPPLPDDTHPNRRESWRPRPGNLSFFLASPDGICVAPLRLPDGYEPIHTWGGGDHGDQDDDSHGTPMALARGAGWLQPSRARGLRYRKPHRARLRRWFSLQEFRG